MREYKVSVVRFGKSEIEQAVVVTDRVSKCARSVFMGLSYYGAVKIECLSPSKRHVNYLGFICGVGFMPLESFYEKLILEYIDNAITPAILEGVYYMVERLKEYKEEQS